MDRGGRISERVDHPTVEALLREPLSEAVAAHLATCPRCRVTRRLHAPPASPPPPPPPLAPSVSAALSLAPSTRIGTWEIGGRLGAGGMAVVYLVRCVRTGRRAALKVMDAPSAEARARLLREASAQGALSHPNVVGLLGVLDVDGAPGLLLELVPGPTLQELLGSGILELPERLALGLDILRGVAAAHQAGIVHRDLKPSNVLVDPTGDRLVARVADFGLARQGTGGLRLTRTGVAMGTPAYMAPEQLKDAASADARADVFSLGAVLYELCTGRRAFEGATPAEVASAVREGRYAPLRALVPDLLPGLAALVEGALRVDRDERPESAVALLAGWASAVSPRAFDAKTRERVRQLARSMDGTSSPRAAPGNLPEPATALVGRDAVLAAVRFRLGLGRWMTVIGARGIGKTALAIEVGRQMRPAFPGGVWLVRIGGLKEATAGHLAEILGATPDPAIDLAARGPTLLVVDGPAAPGPIEAWLAAAPQLKVLTTAPRRLAEEATVALEPLDPPESEALLRGLGLGDEGAVRSIAEIAGGNPLALSLAAGCLRCEPAEDLVSAVVTMSGQPLDAILAHALSLLAAPARAALAGAARLPPSWTPAALREALGAGEAEVAAWLSELTRAGLVWRASGPAGPTFGLGDAVRRAVAALSAR